MKLAPFRLLAPRSASVAGGARKPSRDGAALLGLADRDMSPRARAKLLELLGEFDRIKGEADRLRDRIGELEQLADSDPLADVMNRRAFIRELSKALAFAERHGGPVSVLYVDLKDFKAINDRFGHRVGDAAIVHVSELLKANVRETDTVGRLGGDEFAVILPRASERQAEDKAERLTARLADAPLEFENLSLALRASIGAYETRRGESAESALRCADAAMYAQKRTA